MRLIKGPCHKVRTSYEQRWCAVDALLQMYSNQPRRVTCVVLTAGQKTYSVLLTLLHLLVVGSTGVQPCGGRSGRQGSERAQQQQRNHAPVANDSARHLCNDSKCTLTPGSHSFVEGTSSRRGACYAVVSRRHAADVRGGGRPRQCAERSFWLMVCLQRLATLWSAAVLCCAVAHFAPACAVVAVAVVLQPPLSPQKCRSPHSPMSPTRRQLSASTLRKVGSSNWWRQQHEQQHQQLAQQQQLIATAACTEAHVYAAAYTSVQQHLHRGACLGLACRLAVLPPAVMVRKSCLVKQQPICQSAGSGPAGTVGPLQEEQKGGPSQRLEASAARVVLVRP